MSTWEDSKKKERQLLTGRVHYFAREGEVSLSYSLVRVFLHHYLHTVEATVEPLLVLDSFTI